MKNLELKDTVTELKILIDSLSSRMKTTREISKLENKTQDSTKFA